MCATVTILNKNLSEAGVRLLLYVLARGQYFSFSE